MDARMKVVLPLSPAECHVPKLAANMSKPITERLDYLENKRGNDRSDISRIDERTIAHDGMITNLSTGVANLEKKVRLVEKMKQVNKVGKMALQAVNQVCRRIAGVSFEIAVGMVDSNGDDIDILRTRVSDLTERLNRIESQLENNGAVDHPGHPNHPMQNGAGRSADNPIQI